MSKENYHKDPRYYYIRIVDFKINKEFKFKSQKVHVKLHLGTKFSGTIFGVSDFSNQQKKKSIMQEAHIFKYGGEQFLNVYLQGRFELQQKDKMTDNQKSNKKQTLSGYSRILLPPLIQYPHICHQIKANLICAKNKIQFNKELLGEITFQLFYRLDFRGKIQIIPIAANLERNFAQFGQMKPFLQLSIEGQTWTSLEAQGIHPRWSGHFHAEKQNIPDRKDNFLIKNLGNNVYLNQRTIEQRKLCHQVNLIKNQGGNQKYFDIVRFSLSSAGNFLIIKVFSYPLIGKKPDLVGQAEIRISNDGFFRHPKSYQQVEFIEKDIKLFIKEQQQKINIGNLTVLIRFVFDKNQVLNGGPYIEEMPIPKILLMSAKNIVTDLVFSTLFP